MIGSTKWHGDRRNKAIRSEGSEDIPDSYPLLRTRTSFTMSSQELDEKVAYNEASSVDISTDDLRALYHQVLHSRTASEQDLFDENIEFTKQEERAVVRILDWRLFTAVLLSTFVLNIVRSKIQLKLLTSKDRTNNSNAISAGLPKDLGFNTNVVNTAKLVSYILDARFS